VQTVVLRRGGNRLPVAWRPASLTVDNASVKVTDRRGFETERRYGPGLRYRVLSYAPPRSPDKLRETGRNYPATIAERYTQLPNGTAERVTPFTERLTAEAQSPYETAVRVETWLETNKDYSLNASHEPGADVASEFIFDMEQGYCEYFATTMVVMLRSQGVPARYVTGYSTGQPAGENTYVVRGMNAHAWVEVYFTDVGWVRFDPTPGNDRLAAEQRAFARERTDGGGDGERVEAPDERRTAGNTSSNGSLTPGGSFGGSAGDYQHVETGSPGESFSGRTGVTEASGSSQGPEAGRGVNSQSPNGAINGTGTRRAAEATNTTQAFDIRLNRTRLIPGSTIRVRVTRGEEPISDVTVFFNEEPIGETGPNGAVVGSVPYTDRLNVSVEATETSISAGAVPPSQLGRQFAMQSVPVQFVPEVGDSRLSIENESYRVETNVTVDVTGRPLPGSTVVVNATIDGTPVPAAVVEMNGTRVARTNRSGLARIELPLEAANRRLTVTRGDASGVRSLSVLTTLNVSVTGETYPTGNATVTVTAQGSPVRGAVVQAGNRTVGSTGQNGTVAIQLPESPTNITLTVTHGVATGSRTVQLPALNVTATPTAFMTAPWTDLLVRSTLGGEPAEDVAIRLNRRPVGKTGENGTLTAVVPPSNGVTITAVGYGQRVTTRPGNPIVVLGGAIAVALLIGGIVVQRAQRSGVSPQELETAISERLISLGQWVVAVLVAATAMTDVFIGRLVQLSRRLRTAVIASPTRLYELALRARQRGALAIKQLVSIGRSLGPWILAEGRGLIRLVRNPKLLATVVAGYIQTLRELGPIKQARHGSNESRASLVRTRTDGEEKQSDSGLTVREVWCQFLEYVSVRQWRTKTPGQIATRAIDYDGLPADAVRALTEAFRDAEYGNQLSTTRVERARKALERIERTQRPDRGEKE
jgi:hypothetical protein